MRKERATNFQNIYIKLVGSDTDVSRLLIIWELIISGVLLVRKYVIIYKFYSLKLVK